MEFGVYAVSESEAAIAGEEEEWLSLGVIEVRMYDTAEDAIWRPLTCFRGPHGAQNIPKRSLEV